ncbi:hypothetical protein [uncultured Kushneria sp.]|uniref:hypothetical protein n=1 Tax=uncultured Kushneria sp. TaxID=905033 RepID=UPI0026362618|nr:hypothetical protein [uncultured Kushneria sp.]
MNVTFARDLSIESVKHKKREIIKKARKNRDIKVIGSGTVVVEYNVDKDYFSDIQRKIDKFYKNQK